MHTYLTILNFLKNFLKIILIYKINSKIIIRINSITDTYLKIKKIKEDSIEINLKIETLNKLIEQIKLKNEVNIFEGILDINTIYSLIIMLI